MFKKLLIANRGEIACRIIKTAKKLGISCVAVYSEVDEKAVHVELADEAYCIGAAPSQKSYLDLEKIISVAKTAGCDAIHPGYGFLSENTAFATLCEKNGITFVGPPSAAMDAMASKSQAKALMAKAKVPLIPGYYGKNQKEDFLLKEANKIGYPVLIKPALGGGGKGMKVALQESEFLDNLASAKREAKSSFGDEEVLLEKYIENPRHVEIQIMADKHGNVVHLFERDCSIQRRHQKVLEESPAPHFPEEIRKAMGKAAITAAKSIGYVGAGTIEFLLDKNNNFYFMEMNTRLQVEHPVTEMITQQDLVEWQLRVAKGEPLPLTQAKLSQQGHAMEARIYAEDPFNHFLPSIGKIDFLQEPKTNEYVRIDTGIKQGDTITPYYDPMIAKLIVWGQNREDALLQLQQALSHYHVAGPKTNINFLRTLIRLEDYEKGHLSTHFIEDHETALAFKGKEENTALILASLYYLFSRKTSTSGEDLYSPWNSLSSFRLNLPYTQTLEFTHQGFTHSIKVEKNNNHFTFSIQDKNYSVSGTLEKNSILHSIINGKKCKNTIFMKNASIYIYGLDVDYEFYLPSFSLNHEDEKSHNNQLSSPMPGTLVAIHAAVGNTVKKGEKLVVIEAMKMEHTLYAPKDGKVSEIYYSVGDMVNESVELLKIE